MQIGFDAKRLFFNSTGLGNYSRNLVKNLYQYYPENTYHLYTPRLASHHSFFNKQQFSIHQNTSLPSGIWRSLAQTRNWNKQGIQLYHGLSNELPFKIPANVKTVVTVHDLIFKTLPHTYPPLDRWIYDKKVKFSCEKADSIVVVSQQTKTDLITFYSIDPEKIKIIYPPIASAYFQQTKVIEPLKTNSIQQLPNQYFLCVGTLEKRKNQLQILKAWEQVDAAFQLPIVLVGRGKSYAQSLKQYAKNKKIPVYFLEQIDQLSDLRAIYQRATAFIYPSLYEGFGMPIVEAQLSNIPVITSNCSSLKEVVSPAALLIDPSSTESLAAAIATLLSDQEVFSVRKETGHTFAFSTFHPKILTEQLWTLYTTYHKG